MKGTLIEDYSNPVLRVLARSVLSSFVLENKHVPFVVAFDTMALHFKHWTSIVFNPRSKSAWKIILERYYETDAYKKLNEAVHGNELLSKYATVNFLNTLFKKAKEQLKLGQHRQTVSKDNPIEELLKTLDDTQVSPRQVSAAVDRIVAALEDEAKETLKDIEAAESFSHFGIPVVQLLEKPDEFREMARNKIVVHLVKFLYKLRREAPSLKQAKTPTLVGGRPLGVKKIQRWSELPRALPVEYLDDDLFSYRIASRTLRVSEQYGSIQNYVVYLDKSGSMAGDIKYHTSPTSYEYVPKISFAAASALALAWTLRRYGTKMTLKLFDVEVHEPISDFTELLKVLMKVKADSGTNITKVLEDALRYRDERIIVITDGIDEVSEDAAKKARSENLDITFIFINTDNALLRKYFPCVHVKEARPTVLLEV